MTQKALLTTACLFACLCGHASTAEPITIGFEPLVFETAGEPVNVDLVVSDLESFMHPSLGAFDLTVSFDPGVLSVVGTSFGPFLGNPDAGAAFLDATAVGPGALNLVGISFLSGVELHLLQPESFVLATLTFNPVALGTTPLQLTVNALSNEVGESFPFVKTEQGTGNVIPEPSALLLVWTGLATLAAARRWRQRKSP
jgi:hypothetical protein